MKHGEVMTDDRKDELVIGLKEVLSKIDGLLRTSGFDISDKEHKQLWDEMVDTAFELSKIVKPKHNKYLLKNRECSPDDRKFYEHMDSADSLLRYIEDPHANDDPEDQTIDHEFTLEIYTRRWKGKKDTYHVKRTKTGWYISHMSINGNCDKSGKPYLYRNLYQDFINYPEALPTFMRDIWLQAEEQGLSHDDVQEKLNKLPPTLSVVLWSNDDF